MIHKKFFSKLLLLFFFLFFIMLQFNEFKKKKIILEYKQNSYSDLVYIYSEIFLLNNVEINNPIFLLNNSKLDAYIKILNNYSYDYFNEYNFKRIFNNKNVNVITINENKSKFFFEKHIFINQKLSDEFYNNILKKIEKLKIEHHENLKTNFLSYIDSNNLSLLISDDKKAQFDVLNEKLFNTIKGYAFYDLKITIQNNLSTKKFIIYIFTTILIFCLFFFLISNTSFYKLINKISKRYLNFD